VGELSRRLVAPEPVRGRLAANARHDPVAGVRLLNLLALVRLHPGDAFTAAELRAATSDRDAEVRLRAGIELGKDGRDVLLALAADRAVEDRCSARAIEALGRDFPAEQARAQLARACREVRREPLRPASLRACIAVLGRRGGAEATLINALELGHEQVRVAAADALGAVGSAAAVLPLKEAAERHGGTLASAARNAIAEIQSRLTGSPGELSLAEGEAGHLSLTADVGGRVSLPGANPSSTDKSGSR
jgi:HEAT repeat protein